MRRACLLAVLSWCMLAFPLAAAAEEWQVHDVQRETKILERLLAILEKDPFNAYAFQQIKSRVPNGDNLDALIERYQAELAKSPSDTVLLIILGRFEAQRGAQQRCIDYLSEAQRQGETSWQLLSLRGQAYAELGLSEEANADFEAALEKADDVDEQIDILRELGDIALRAGRQEEAVQRYLHIVERRPKDKYLRWELGAIFHERQLWEQAIEQYRVAAELAGRNIEERSRAELEIAGLYLLLDRQDDAIVIYEAIMERSKGSHWLHREARHQWIEAYRGKADPSTLLTKVETHLAKTPKAEWALLLRAQLLLELGRHKESLDAFDAYLAVQSSPEPATLNQYLQLLRAHGELERILQRYDEIIKASPDESQRLFIVLDLSRYLANGAGIPFEAYAVLRQYEPGFQESASWLALANSYRSLGSGIDIERRSAALLEKVLSADPERLDALLSLFDMYLAASNGPAAQGLVERLLDSPHIDAARVEAFANVYAQHGRLDAIQALYEQALQRAPQNVALLFLRATLLDPKQDLNLYLLAWKQILLESDDGEQLLSAAQTYTETLFQHQILEEASALVERQRAQDPQQWRLTRLLFYLYIRQERLDDALALMPLMSRHLNTGYGLEEHALSLLEQRSPQQALRLLRRLVERGGVHSWRYEIRAAQLFFQHHNDQQAAVSLLESAIAKVPENPNALYDAALVYLNLQRHGDAKALLLEAVRLSPRSFPMRFGLADAASRMYLANANAENLDFVGRGYELLIEALPLAADAQEMETAMHKVVELGRVLQKSGGVIKSELERVADGSNDPDAANAIRAFAQRIPANLAREYDFEGLEL